MHLNRAIYNVCDLNIDPHVCFFPTLSQDRARPIPLAQPEACPQHSEKPVCARSPHISRNGYPRCLWCIFCSHYVSLSGLFMWDSSLLWRCSATLLSKFSNNNCLQNTVCLRMILLLPGPPSEKFTVFFFYHGPPFMTWVLSTNHMSRLFFR